MAKQILVTVLSVNREPQNNYLDAFPTKYIKFTPDTIPSIPAVQTRIDFPIYTKNYNKVVRKSYYVAETVAQLVVLANAGSAPTPVALGTINQENTWANLNDYSVNNGGATIAASGGNLNFSGTPTLFASNLRFTKAGSPFAVMNLEQWTQRVSVTTPASLTGSSYGIGIGVKSINGTTAQSNSMRWSWDTGDNHVYFYPIASLTGQVTSAGTLTPTASTAYVIDVNRNKNVFTFTIFAANGTTQLFQTVFTAPLTYPANGYVAHNTGSFELNYFGGGAVISNWTTSSTARRYEQYCGIADSNALGLYAGTNAIRFLEQALTSKSKTFNICAGYGDHTSEIVSALAFYQYMAPTLGYILNIGRNDVADGVSQATYTANISTIITGLETIKAVIIVTPIASIQDLAIIVGIYMAKPNVKCDLWTATKNGVNQLTGTYATADNIHMNATGHNFAATTVAAVIP